MYAALNDSNAFSNGQQKYNEMMNSVDLIVNLMNIVDVNIITFTSNLHT